MSFVKLIASTCNRVYNDVKHSFETKFANCKNPPKFVGNNMNYTIEALDNFDNSLVEISVCDSDGKLKMTFTIDEDEYNAQELVEKITHYMCSFINIISGDIVYMYDKKTKEITCSSIGMTLTSLDVGK